MSAYVVSEKTLGRILRYFDAISFDNERKHLLSPLQEAGYLLRLSQSTGLFYKDFSDLAQDMIKMNCQAVNFRYETEENKPYQWTSNLPNLPPLIQAIKSLDCFLYQCSEGDFPETPLYKALDSVRLKMYSHFVQYCPEYNACDWG